jgi:DNA-binding response OmpR family regulator
LVSKKQLELYGKGRSVLIVDDDSITRKIIFRSLQGYFSKVVVSADGEDALIKYKEQNGFDIVVTDINMPKMNGLDLAKALRSINQDQSIIILSSTTDANSLISLIEIGVDNFLLKPFDFDKLARKILNILENASFKQIIENFKRDQIINEYEKNHNICSIDDSATKKDLIYRKHQNIARAKIEDEKEDDKVTIVRSIEKEEDVRSAMDFFMYLEKNKDKLDSAGDKITKILSDAKLLELSINELILFANNIDDAIGYSEAEKIMENISRNFSSVYYSLNEFSLMHKIAETFFEFHLFFADYKNLDELSPREVEELLNIEFILNDMKDFISDVFVTKKADNIFLYTDLFKQNLSQLEANINNADKALEDFDEGELDFF